MFLLIPTEGPPYTVPVLTSEDFDAAECGYVDLVELTEPKPLWYKGDGLWVRVEPYKR